MLDWAEKIFQGYWRIIKIQKPITVSIWSASYSLEKNSDSGGEVTSFTNQARTCTCTVHVISQQ